MMIKKNCLGLTFSKRTKNGCHFNVTITDDPDNFALYKALGLDVFEKHIPAQSVIEVVEEKPKKKKKNDSTEID